MTNLVLMEMGHPLHVFDFAKIENSQVIIRKANEGEKLVGLDGVERELKSEMLLIDDPIKPLALAGIIGGLESEITTETSDILLESAWFDPTAVRKTAKFLGLHTEASHRFERVADIGATIKALNQAAKLIQQLAGGEILSGIIDLYDKPLVLGVTVITLEVFFMQFYEIICIDNNQRFLIVTFNKNYRLIVTRVFSCLFI